MVFSLEVYQNLYETVLAFWHFGDAPWTQYSGLRARYGKEH